MRYRILAQLIEMCDTLSEAVTYLLTTQNSEESGMLLSTCGEMLQAIISTLQAQEEAIEDKSLLGEVEAVKAILASKRDMEKATELLVGIKPKLINGVKYRYRVIFIAELGEKWDSLESVYKAFLQKDNCDVSIVLAPIYRENGGKKQVIYKDYFTPMGIPFIDYNNYDIEKDMPDLAITCQPYESVTEAAFWPENIAKYTRLVYVPYYAAHMFYNDSVVTSCRMPIFHCAWKVIGSSKKHYKFYSKNSYDNGKNMLVTGVPKWDGVVKLKNDGIVETSSEWDKKLKGKKVFLWNSFYDLGSSSLGYWQEILKYFESHSDCGLIWRMHPMTKTVIELYGSEELLKSLLTIESYAAQMPNVVVDTNVAYYQAFYYSDAQISDFSSMMTQYLLMDKPLLWLKNPTWQFTECAIDNAWMETADNAEEIIEFFDRIKDNKDNKKEQREMIRKRDIPLADGKAGQRVCDITLELLEKETIGQL